MRQINLFILLFLILTSCNPKKNSDTPAPVPATPPKQESPLELPKIETSEHLYKRTGYSLVFSKPEKLARWVAYHLTAEHIKNGDTKRTNDFHADPEIEGSASLQDYEKSGYDRGHLAPASDMSWSETAMSESFLMTNMTPQLPSLNRGIWKQLEEAERKIALEDSDLYIATGPVITENLKKIGSGVSVPEKYFKVFYEVHNGIPRAIAFIIPQEFQAPELCKYSMTLQEAEKITGISFFDFVTSKKDIEASADCSSWISADLQSNIMRSTASVAKKKRKHKATH